MSARSRPGPTASTTPAKSPPSTWGSETSREKGWRPVRVAMSRVLETATAPTRTRASPGPGDGSRTSSRARTSASPNARITMARISVIHHVGVDDAPLVSRAGRWRPHLWSLRPLLMPGTGLEVLTFLVEDEVDLGEQLDDVPVRVAMVGEDVVPHTVASGPPD